MKAVPHAELIVLPGIGHLVQNAATEQVIAAIEQLMPQAALRRRPRRGARCYISPASSAPT